MVALSIEDVALIKRCEIIAAVRFRGGATGVIKRGVTFHEYGNVFRPGRGERRLAEDQGTQKMPGGKPLLKISLVLLQDFPWNVLLSIVVVISKFVAQSIRTHIPGSLHLLPKKVRWIKAYLSWPASR